VAVKIRLMRVGKKKQPTYRVVVADSRSPRDGRFIEILGQYEPRQDPSRISLDTDRAVHWLRHGAQPTEQVGKILEVAGVWDAYKTATGSEAAAKPKPKAPKPKQVKEAPKAEAPAAAEATEAADAPAEEAAEDAAADTPAAEESPSEESSSGESADE
jgi:small subunit ribosomal protein S16